MSMSTRLPEISRQARNDGGDRLETTAFYPSFRPERNEMERSGDLSEAKAFTSGE